MLKEGGDDFVLNRVLNPLKEKGEMLMMRVLFIDEFGGRNSIHTLNTIPRIGERVAIFNQNAKVTDVIHIIDPSFLATYGITEQLDVVIML